MDVNTRIEELFEKEAYLIDILPKSVPQDAGGRYFSVEEYFRSHRSDLDRSLTRIILGLYCFYDMTAVTEEGTAEQPQADTPGETGGTVQNVSNSAGSEEVDMEFNVQAFAESYPVYAMTGANLRATPSQDGEIIQTIASGSSLTALGYTDRWYKVQSNGVIGYVNRNLFSDEPVE